MRSITIRRLLCLAALGAGAVLIGFRGGSASFLLFWSALLIPVSALLYRRITAERLRAHVAVEQRTAMRGESTACTLTLTNDSLLPLVDVRIRLTSGKAHFPDVPTEQRCSLMPGETIILTFRLACLHCGEAVVGAEEICAGDLFALTERRFREVSKIQILPRTQQLRDLVIAPARQSDRRSAVGSCRGDAVPDGQLKPYVPGEDVRRIHWKVSALQGRPILLSVTPEPKTEIVLLPDARAALPAGEARWLAQDSVVEGTLAIADFFLRAGMISRVVADGRRAVDVFAPSHYRKLYELCTGDFFSGSERPDELMERDMLSRAGNRSYIILTWEVDEVLVRRCAGCLDVGARVAVVYVGEDTKARSLAAADRRIAFYQVTGRRDIFAVLGGTGEVAE